VEEIEASSFFFTLDVFYCQLIILLKDLGNIFLSRGWI